MSINLWDHRSNSIKIILLKCCVILRGALCEKDCVFIWFVCVGNVSIFLNAQNVTNVLSVVSK